jgi:hypothetical protein
MPAGKHDHAIELALIDHVGGVSGDMPAAAPHTEGVGSVSVQGLVEVAVPVVIVATLVWVWIGTILSEARHRRLARKAHRRAERSYYAAIEAAEDNPSFAPETIEWSARLVVALAQRVWSDRDDRELDGRSDGALILAWARARQSQLGEVINVKGRPAVELLRVVNRGGEDEDRVIVRVGLRLRCEHANAAPLGGGYTVHLDERWTLGRDEDLWVLRSVDGNPLTEPVLAAPLIPNRASDDERLTEESLAELAQAHRLGTDAALSELVSPDERPNLAMLDLSVLDDRFLPPLVAAELTHLLDAWEIATSGSMSPLSMRASTEATIALLSPTPGLRLIIRDAMLQSWLPTNLKLSLQPPSIELMLTINAVCYCVGDDGSTRMGEPRRPSSVTLRWVLELTDDPQIPWRLATTSDICAAILSRRTGRPTLLDLAVRLRKNKPSHP